MHAHDDIQFYQQRVDEETDPKMKEVAMSIRDTRRSEEQSANTFIQSADTISDLAKSVGDLNALRLAQMSVARAAGIGTDGAFTKGDAELASGIIGIQRDKNLKMLKITAELKAQNRKLRDTTQEILTLLDKSLQKQGNPADSTAKWVKQAVIEEINANRAEISNCDQIDALFRRVAEIQFALEDIINKQAEILKAY